MALTYLKTKHVALWHINQYGFPSMIQSIRLCSAQTATSLGKASWEADGCGLGGLEHFHGGSLVSSSSSLLSCGFTCLRLSSSSVESPPNQRVDTYKRRFLTWARDTLKQLPKRKEKGRHCLIQKAAMVKENINYAFLKIYVDILRVSFLKWVWITHLPLFNVDLNYFSLNYYERGHSKWMYVGPYLFTYMLTATYLYVKYLAKLLALWKWIFQENTLCASYLSGLKDVLPYLCLDFQSNWKCRFVHLQKFQIHCTVPVDQQRAPI